MNYLLTVDIDTGSDDGITAVKLTTAILNALARGATDVPALHGLTGLATLVPPPEKQFRGDEPMVIDFTLTLPKIETIN